MTIYFN